MELTDSCVVANSWLGVLIWSCNSFTHNFYTYSPLSYVIALFTQVMYFGYWWNRFKNSLIYVYFITGEPGHVSRCFISRTDLFDRLVEFFPDHMTQPRSNLIDFITLQWCDFLSKLTSMVIDHWNASSLLPRCRVLVMFLKHALHQHKMHLTWYWSTYLRHQIINLQIVCGKLDFCVYYFWGLQLDIR